MARLSVWMTATVLLAGCPGTDDTDLPADACGEASLAYGARVCVHRVGDVPTLESLSQPHQGAIVTKYLAPSREQAPLDALVMDLHTFALHHDMLAQGFPTLYADLTPVAYLDLILTPGPRQYFAGTLTLHRDASGEWVGFEILEDGNNPASSPTREQVEAVWSAFADDPGLPTLTFVPSSDLQRAHVQSWDDLPFPVQRP